MANRLLTDEEKRILKKFGKEFQSWKDTEDGASEMKDSRDREKYLKEKLSRENLDTMDDDGFLYVYNKTYVRKSNWIPPSRYLRLNGIVKIRSELTDLLYSEKNIGERYDKCRENLEQFGPSIISEILMFMFPDKYCCWNYQKRHMRSELSQVLPDCIFRPKTSGGEKYFGCIQTMELIKKELEEYGVKDFIDLHMLLWHRGRSVDPGTDESTEHDEKIRKIIETVKQNRQIILYGPPGTGKTFTAKKIATQILSQESSDVSRTSKEFKDFQEEGSVYIMQFHPSYSYEDFVQGIKPVIGARNSITYKVRDGIFKKICQYEDRSGDDIRILIIDEINRGNLSKIFGELIYALEYRGEKIRLQYADFDDDESNESLLVPENLYIIGTMNTADRSISLFDTAMRRRFAFIPMMVDYDLVAKKIDLEKFDKQELNDKLESKPSDHDERLILSLLAVFKLNQMISEDLRMGREKQIGHTYLLKIAEDESEFLNVWKYKIMPLLEEFYTSKLDKLQEILNGSNIIDGLTGLKDFSEQELLDMLRLIIKT